MNQLNSAEETVLRPQAEHSRIGLWSTLFIAALFSAVSLLSSPIPGVNEPHYFAKSRAFIDPSWCQRDFFLTSANAHYCFFWLVGQLTQWLPFGQIAVAGRVLSSLLLAIGWAMVGRAVQLRQTFCVASAAGFASLSLLGSFSGEWLLGGFESKVPAWGLCLMAVGLWIMRPGHARTMLLAGMICGLGCSLHPVVGGWVAACICIGSATMLLTERLRGIQHAPENDQQASVSGLLAFASMTILFALPGLTPALNLVLDKSLPEKERELASFYQVFWRLKHHLDPTEIPSSQWLYLFWMSTVLGAAFFFLKRASSGVSRDDGLRKMLLFFGVSAAIAGSGIIIGWHTVRAQEMDGWEWRASLLKFYPFRCFDALLPVTTALVLGRLFQTLAQKSKQDASNALKSLGKNAQNPAAYGFIAIIVVAILPLLQSWQTREATPAGYTADQFSDWQTACSWLKENTPKDALVLTPRESTGFKWFAERAEYVCYKDCPQDAAGILTWNQRLWLLHDWTLKSSTDGLYDKSDLLKLRLTTDCDFILTRILGPFEIKPLWEGQHWRVYAVPPRD